MKMMRNKINEVFTLEDLMSSSLIQTLHDRYDLDFESTSIDYLMNSGEKYISNLVQYYLDTKSTSIMALNSISLVITGRFKDKWDKISLALKTDYAPLENYSMEEKESTNTNVKTTSKGSSSSNGTSGSDSGVYGYNSIESTPSSTSKSNANQENQQSSEDSVVGSEDDNYRKLTRHGNIGVTTSQQMLQSEIELRQYDFVKEIFKDIDSMLCLKCY